MGLTCLSDLAGVWWGEFLATQTWAEKEEILDSSQVLGWFKLANALKIRF